MQRRGDSITALIGPMLLALFALTLFAPRAGAHDVHEHAHAPEAVSNDAPRNLLQAFRATGDDAYLDRAWSLLEPRLQHGSSDPTLLIDAALVAQARHRFDTALELTRSALAQDRHDDQAWLLLASIHLVTGEIELAGEACGELSHAPLLVVIGCKARVAHANGQAASARPPFERLLSVTDATRVETDTFAWALSVAGDLAVATDEADAAIDFFSRSLSLVESAQVRSALVDVLLDDGRLSEARAALAHGSEALPLDVRRLIVATRQGRTADVAARIAAVDHRFREWIAAEDWLHAREMARFYLDVTDCPALARRLALINIDIQKEPEDQRLLRRTAPQRAAACAAV